MAEAELDLIDVLETAPVGAIILDDRDNQVLFWNTSVLAILGDLQGEAFARAASRGFFHNDQDFEVARCQLASAGSLRNYETRIFREDSHESWAMVSMRPIRFENNAATLIWYFDITDAKRREHQLERSQDALLEVLDAAPTGAALTDGPERICYWNSALLDIFPGSGGDPATAIRGGIAQAHVAIDKEGQGTTFRIPMLDGSERFVAAWKFAVEFEGAPAELIWLHDVTELRRAERTAQAATAAKSAFLATMSHEIRTPMNGVMAIAELLAETPLNGDQAGMIAIIQQSGESLIRVINDILDFSKLESSQLQVENIPFRLDEVLDGVLQLLKPKAAEKGLALHVLQHGNDDSARVGDPLRLRQVLLNLVGNAIKFTASGSVTLDADATSDDVSFRIIDTGIGIAADKIAKLFMPYQQAEAATARNYGGTGLGLSISNALLTLMGGSLRVRSTLGRGSCFTVELNLPRDAKALPRNAQCSGAAETQFWSKADRAAAEANGAVILCAEDNPTNRDVLARVLDRLGMVYEMVEDGAQALAVLDRSRHGLVLTDGHMPNMGGWELAHAIRAAETEIGLARLPVVMVTADAVSQLANQIDQADIDACLTKPLRRHQVEAAILTALPVWTRLRQPLHKSNFTSAVAGGALNLTGLVELVGDDRDVLRSILQDFLSGATTLQAELAAAMVCGDREKVMLATHAIKGSAGYAGASVMIGYAEELERKAQEGVAFEVLTVQFDALTKMIKRLPEDIETSLAGYFA